MLLHEQQMYKVSENNQHPKSINDKGQTLGENECLEQKYFPL